MGNEHTTIKYEKDDSKINELEAQLLRLRNSNSAAQQAQESALQAMRDKADAQKASNEESLKQSQANLTRMTDELKQKSQAEMDQLQRDAQMQLQRTLDMIAEIQKKQNQQAAELELQRKRVNDLLTAQRAEFDNAQAEMKEKLQAAALISEEAHQKMLAEVQARTESMMATIRQTESDKAKAEEYCARMLRDQQAVQQRTCTLQAELADKIEAQKLAQSRLAEQAGSSCNADSNEANRLSEKFGNKSKQSLGVMSKSVTQVKQKELLEKAIQNQVDGRELDQMRGRLEKSNVLAKSFAELINQPGRFQASSANGPFVLGTGCSEVCPLIAFLQGSMKKDRHWSGECKGTNFDSSHNKVTYQFCFDQNDPSKMKVVSFAPHVANN